LRNSLRLSVLFLAALSGCDNGSSRPPPVVQEEVKASSLDALLSPVKSERKILNLDDFGLAAISDKSGERLVADIDNNGQFDTIQFAKVDDVNRLTNSGVRITSLQWLNEQAESTSVVPKKNDTVIMVYSSGVPDKAIIAVLWPFESVSVLTSDAKFKAEYVLCWPVEAKTALFLNSENGGTVVYALGNTFKAESCGA
jgi:hypothetical protein